MAIEEAKDAKQKKVTIDDEDYKIKKLERKIAQLNKKLRTLEKQQAA